MKQANPYAELVVSGVNHCGKIALQQNCRTGSVKPSSWLRILQCGRPK